MTKKLISLILASSFIFLNLIFPHFVRAEGKIEFSEQEVKLNLVLKRYNSPLQGYEKELIQTAKQYNLDWALLAAIAGTESAFAKRMPYQCINPFGWGIYGQNKLCFASFSQAIQVVGKGIGIKYDTSSLEKIAKTYNSANTSHWLKLTRRFLYQIKNQSIPASKLPITL